MPGDEKVAPRTALHPRAARRRSKPGIARRGIARERSDGTPQRIARLSGGRGGPAPQPPALPTRPREPRAWHSGPGTYCEHPWRTRQAAGASPHASRCEPARQIAYAFQRLSAQAYSSLSRPYVSTRDARNAARKTRCWPSGSHRTNSGLIISSLLDTKITNKYPQCMETREALRHGVRHARPLKTRLHVVTTRLNEAARERIRADRNFKRHCCRHLGSAPSRAPQRHPLAIRSPGLGTPAPSAGRLPPAGTPEPGLERRSAARAGAGHVPQDGRG